MSAMTRLPTLAVLALFVTGAAPEAVAQRVAEPIRQSPLGLLKGYGLGVEVAWSHQKTARSSVVIKKQPPLFFREDRQFAIGRTALFLAPDGRFTADENKEGWWDSWGRCTAGIVGGAGLGVLLEQLVREIPTDYQIDATVGIVLGGLAGGLAGALKGC